MRREFGFGGRGRAALVLSIAAGVVLVAAVLYGFGRPPWVGDESRAVATRVDLDDAVTNDVAASHVGPRACLTRAASHMREAEYARAIPDLELLEEMFPTVAVYPLWLGICKEQLGRDEPALAHFARAVELKDDLIKAHLRRAELLERQGRYDEAIRHYRRVLVHRSGDMAVLQRLARALSMRSEGVTPPGLAQR